MSHNANLALVEVIVEVLTLIFDEIFLKRHLKRTEECYLIFLF